MDELSNLLSKAYDSLRAEDIFSRAKEYSWQTFFHHSASVAVIAYKLGELIKKYATGLTKLSITEIEERFRLDYRYLLFLVGLAHDRVKLFKVKTAKKYEQEDEAAEEEEFENVIAKFLGEVDRGIMDFIIDIARTVEGIYTTTIDENVIIYVSSIVRVADGLMSVKSIDEALAYLETSKDVGILQKFGVKFGYIKTSTPSILQAKISSKVIEVLEKHGWIPLVIYYNGLIVVGSVDVRPVPLREVYNVVEIEVSSVFDVETILKEIVNGLKRKTLHKIYQLLEQSKEPREGKDIELAYHAIIVRYLNRASISELLQHFEKMKKEAELIDPRTMATGFRGKGSIYFIDELKKIIATSEELADRIASMDNEDLFLILAYAMAYPSKEGNPLGVEHWRNIKMDKELLRILAIAEAYKISKMKDKEERKEAILKIIKKLNVKGGLEPYIEGYLKLNIKSDVVDVESSTLSRSETTNISRRYCRVCRIPIIDEGFKFIDYARDLDIKGSASELWLPDDEPLSDLENVAKEARYICPLCYYESRQLKGKYNPPFFVLALHPVVAYDLWLWVKNRAGKLVEIVPRVDEIRKTVAELYAKLLMSKGKIEETSDIKYLLEEIVGSLDETRRREPLILFDNLGARLFISAGGGYAVRRKDVAVLVALAPLYISIAGGGQVCIASTLTDSYNIGVEQRPILSPHPITFVDEVLTLFEEIKRGRGSMRMEEYAIYDRSYFTVLLCLYIYGLKILSWCRRDNLRDYSNKLLAYMSSIPYTPLALSAPPPPGLDPREVDEIKGRDSRLPYYDRICVLSHEVEELMSQASKLVKKDKPPSLDKSLYIYAVNLRELKSNLKKHGVQKPLREAIGILLQYADAVGEESAKSMAIDIFLMKVAFITETSLDKEKVIENKKVSYRTILFNVFSDIADTILKLRKELPPQHLGKLIEVMLDSAYEKYRHAE